MLPLSDGDVGGELVQTVDARRLHTYLGNGAQFSHWIGDRIEQYQLIENVDFVVDRENSLRTDYHLTLDTAKELAMVERNAKGKEARQGCRAHTSNTAQGNVTEKTSVTMHKSLRFEAKIW